MKRTLWLFAAVVLLSSAAWAGPACFYCSATGHGGGNPCVLGGDGVGNQFGCYCSINPQTHVCKMAGCPCACTGNSLEGWECECYCNMPIAKVLEPYTNWLKPAAYILRPARQTASAPQVPTINNDPTPENIQAQHLKWLADIKSDEEAGWLKPDARLVWHAASLSCLKNGGAFMIGLTMAAAETGHPIKWIIGDSKNDSVQDKIDQGLPIN